MIKEGFCVRRTFFDDSDGIEKGEVEDDGSRPRLDFSSCYAVLKIGRHFEKRFFL